MVTCSKCGTSNRDDARFCVNCGASLYLTERRERREDTCFGQPESRVEGECFGLPFGRAIIGLIVGIFIILLGLSMIFEFNLGRWTGPFILIVVGALIIAGVIRAASRRRS